MPGEMTIRMKARGEHFTVGSLIRALERTVELLRRMDARLSTRESLLDWQVEALSANAELRLTVKGNGSGALIPLYMRGMRMLETGAGVPAEFDDEDLANARRLVGLLEKDIDSITITAPGEDPVTPTRHVMVHVDAILRKRYRYSHGSIQGNLEMLAVHGANAFAIRDALTSEKTACEFPDDMHAQAYAAAGKRVTVTGTIRFDKQGRAISIDAETMQEKPSDEMLPQFRAGEEIDITGGMDSAEYIRGMRDAE